VRLPPIFWYERDAAEDRRLLMVSLLFWDWQQQRTNQRLLLPVFYRWREADRSFLVSLPFVAAYRGPTDRWTVAGPVFRRSDEAKTRTVVFPLYWQKVRREGGRVTVFPPFVFYDYRSRDRSRIDHASLAGWSRRRPDKDLGFRLLYWWSLEPEQRFHVLFPAYWRHRADGRALDLLGPLYLRRTRVADVDLAPPYRETDAAVSTRTFAGVLPLVGAGWGPGYRSHYLFPLYFRSVTPRGGAWATLPVSRFRRDDARAGHVGPYYYSRDPDLRVDGVFPLWHRRRAADGFEASDRFLTYYRRRENDESFQTVFPLYARWKSPEGSRFLTWGAWGSRTPVSASGWAGLYHWSRAENGDRTRVLFPLYWHFRRPPGWQVDVVPPFYTRYRDGDDSVTFVPPFLWRRSGGRTTWSAFFLYWRDRSEDKGSLTLVPFFHDRYDASRRRFFSPLGWTRRSAASREGLVPPVYWYRSAENRRLVVFPLYWGSEGIGRKLTIAPPYYFWRRKESRAYGVFPLWGRHFGPRERGSYVLPFYWHTGDGEGNGAWIVPLALTYVAKEGAGTEKERSLVQYLLFGTVDRGPGPARLEHDFFPLYKYVRRQDYRNFWAPRGLALAAWERSPEGRKGYVFPYAWRRSPGRDWDLFFPLYYASSDYDTTESTDEVKLRGGVRGGFRTVFPLYWSGRGPDRSFRFFAPLYAQYRDGPRRLALLLPVWTSYDTQTGGKFRMLFPLYWRFLMKPAAGEPGLPVERDISVVGPFFRVDARSPERRSRTVGLAPFFSSTRSGANDSYFEVLGGLFARDVQNGRRRFRWLYVFRTRPRVLPNPGGPS
jgi:hypothetical protein